MPIPTFTILPPDPEFNDIVKKFNKLTAEMQNLFLTLDSLNVVSLTADHIDAGTIDANIVTIRSDLAAGAYVQIDGNGMIINNGSINTFVADINGAVTMTSATIVNDLTGTGSVSISNAGITINNGSVDTFSANSNGDVTMTSATIRSLDSIERIEIDSSGLHSYDDFGIERVTLADTPDQSTKALYFWDEAGPTGTNVGFITYGTATIDGASRTGLFVTGTGGSILGALFLSDNGIVELVTDAAAPTGFRAIDGNRPEINGGGGWQDIAVAGVATDSAGSHTHGIPNGTQLLDADGVTIWTFLSEGTHTHSQN